MAHTVLLVDAEQTQRDLLTHMLQQTLTYQTTSVASGREAMQYVMTETLPSPDVILFDASTIENSCETIANLKILTSHIPILTLVKYGDYEAAMETLSAGAQDFLCKPVAMERMKTTIRNLLSMRDLRRESEWLRRDRMNETHGKFAAGTHSAILPFNFTAEDGNIRRMEELEAEAIRYAMQHYNGRMTEVARRLGIGRSTLYRKLNDMNIRQTEAA